MLSYQILSIFCKVVYTPEGTSIGYSHQKLAIQETSELVIAESLQNSVGRMSKESCYLITKKVMTPNSEFVELD
jgi:hypothetical protein